ncbi:MAG: hypothetical protein OXE95_08850 [Chloroflexi bacterium]|nr:hypothetical protein [Chloroflexota bacterium]MCY4247667.1 hypothetical protein [Chloroflexota bacterium]
MQNVAPTRRLNRRSRDVLLAAALLFLLGAALLVAGIGLHIVNLAVPGNSAFALYDLARKSMPAVGALLCIASMPLALRAASWRTDNALAWELGEGLAAELDQRFVFIRNISQRGIGYVDAALVSRHGVLLLRITQRRGEYRNEGGSWLRRGRDGRWRTLRWSPTREVVASALRVESTMQARGLGGVPIFAAVVFMREEPAAQIHARQPAVPVVHASALVSGLRDSYFAAWRLDARTTQQAVDLLYH